MKYSLQKNIEYLEKFFDDIMAIEIIIAFKENKKLKKEKIIEKKMWQFVFIINNEKFNFYITKNQKITLKKLKNYLKYGSYLLLKDNKGIVGSCLEEQKWDEYIKKLIMREKLYNKLPDHKIIKRRKL